MQLLFYAILTLGAAGVYLAMPQGRARPGRVWAIVSAGALAGLLGFLAAMLESTTGRDIFFLLFAAIALFGGVRVITHRKPVYSAVYFVLVVLASAGMLLLLHAEFLAVALVMIYAGAIMVTYVFVIMLAQQSGAPTYDVESREPVIAVGVGFLLAASIGGIALDKSNWPTAIAAAGQPAATSDGVIVETPADRPTVLDIGQALLTRHVVALQLAGVLLLVAMVGAIALVKRRLVDPEAVGPLAHETGPPGEIGRHVDPF